MRCACSTASLLDVLHVRHVIPPRAVLTLGDWSLFFVSAKWTACSSVSTSHLRRPRMKKIVTALLTPPSCRPLFACTVLTLFLRVLDRDSQVEKVCGSFSVVHILNAHTHTHHELHVTDGATGHRPCSACPSPSASLSTRYLASVLAKARSDHLRLSAALPQHCRVK